MTTLDELREQTGNPLALWEPILDAIWTSDSLLIRLSWMIGVDPSSIISTFIVCWVSWWWWWWGGDALLTGPASRWICSSLKSSCRLQCILCSLIHCTHIIFNRLFIQLVTQGYKVKKRLSSDCCCRSTTRINSINLPRMENFLSIRCTACTSCWWLTINLFCNQARILIPEHRRIKWLHNKGKYR